MAQKRKIILWTAGAAVLMLLVPWLAAAFIPADAGMLVMLLLLFAADPFFSLLIGFFSGSDARHLFWLPILSAALAFLGMQLALGIGTAEFLLYAAVYLALGLAAMGARALYRRRIQKQEEKAREGLHHP